MKSKNRALVLVGIIFLSLMTLYAFNSHSKKPIGTVGSGECPSPFCDVEAIFIQVKNLSCPDVLPEEDSHDCYANVPEGKVIPEQFKTEEITAALESNFEGVYRKRKGPVPDYSPSGQPVKILQSGDIGETELEKLKENPHNLFVNLILSGAPDAGAENGYAVTFKISAKRYEWGWNRSKNISCSIDPFLPTIRIEREIPGCFDRVYPIAVPLKL